MAFALMSALYGDFMQVCYLTQLIKTVRHVRNFELKIVLSVPFLKKSLIVVVCLKMNEYPLCFLTILTEGGNFCDFLFASQGK